MDRAAHKDALELHSKVCPDRTYKMYCDGGREQTEECLKNCPR